MIMNGIQKNAGFTLVEIAIVLVIIGLLLGGVLKGQEMIENARIKNLVNDMNGIAAAFHAYQDRYKALPGDDTLASNAGRGWTDAVAGTGNGRLSNSNAFDAGNNENQLLWQHLRYAGFISGNPAGTTNNVGGRANPNHSYNGKLGASAATTTWGLGLRGNIICASAVPGKAAQAVDSNFDDGLPNSGTVRGRLATTGTPEVEEPTGAVGATAYIDDSASLYTVCKSL
jgi:prepilin-type N-terminal cleavage/methylation domain-containing protein